jgi:hypothetical protein
MEVGGVVGLERKGNGNDMLCTIQVLNEVTDKKKDGRNGDRTQYE